MNTESNYTHVNNIKETKVKIFFVRLSDNEHRLLRPDIKLMVLLKTFNGTLSACDRFILKIFFYEIKRMYM